jgi:hypothetical protein
MPSAVMHFYSGQPIHFFSGVDTEDRGRYMLDFDEGLGSLSVCEHLSGEVLSLSTHDDLDKVMVGRICAAVRESF